MAAHAHNPGYGNPSIRLGTVDDEIVLARTAVKKLSGLMDDSGERALEMAIRRTSMSMDEAEQIVQEAARRGEGVATGKQIAEVYKELDQEELYRNADGRMERLAGHPGYRGEGNPAIIADNPARYVLSIRELGSSWAGRSPVVRRYPTEQAAKDALISYVRENWEAELGGLEMPDDPEEMIQAYFEDVDEQYDIIQVKGGKGNPAITADKGIRFVLGIRGRGDKRKSEVQSVLFQKEQWTEAGAKEWLEGHGFKYGQVDEGGEHAGYLRFRQEEPGMFEKFRVIEPWGEVEPGPGSGKLNNPFGEPLFRKPRSYWSGSGGGSYSTKAEAVAAALDHGRSRGMETVQIYQIGGGRAAGAIVLDVATGKPIQARATDNPSYYIVAWRDIDKGLGGTRVRFFDDREAAQTLYNGKSLSSTVATAVLGGGSGYVYEWVGYVSERDAGADVDAAIRGTRGVFPGPGFRRLNPGGVPEPDIPPVIYHSNMEPLLDALQQEPEFQPGPQKTYPQAWYRRKVYLEFPTGELAEGGLKRMALVGWPAAGKREPQHLPIKGDDRFNAQGLEGKVRVEKDLFGALMNMDLLPVHRGRIVVPGRGKGNPEDVRRNPEDTAAEMYETFHGQPSESVTEITEQEHYHGHLAELGVLVTLKVRTLSGLEATLGFGQGGEEDGGTGAERNPKSKKGHAPYRPGNPLIGVYKPRFVTMAQLNELINLYHLARVPLSGKSATPYERMVWAADAFHKKHPEISNMAAYKDLSAQLDPRRDNPRGDKSRSARDAPKIYVWKTSDGDWTFSILSETGTYYHYNAASFVSGAQLFNTADEAEHYALEHIGKVLYGAGDVKNWKKPEIYRSRRPPDFMGTHTGSYPASKVPLAKDTPRIEVNPDYSGLMARSQGRLSEDEAFVMTHVSHFGSEGYPIHKSGSRWTWGPVRGIKGPPVLYGTKQEAVQAFEAYLDILRDKLAGRINPGAFSPDTGLAAGWKKLQALSEAHALKLRADLSSGRFIGGRKVGIAVPEDIQENVEILGRGDEREIKNRIHWYSMYYPDLDWRKQKRNPQPVLLCSNEDGTQLYFVGGDQSLPLDDLKMGSGTDWLKDHMTIGVIDEITYRTRKAHDDFEVIDYFHQLGEETGRQPLLAYDTMNQALSISGGQYKIKAEGITN